MKKLTGTLALVLAVFSIFYFSNTTLASKAAFVIGPSTQTVDVSNGDLASFQLSNLDNAKSVRVEVSTGGAYVTVLTLDDIQSTGTYTRTAAQMQSQFGNFSGSWRIIDNADFNHYSGTASITVQP